MKKIILRTLIAAAIAISGSTFGYGQLTQIYRAHIPFDFSVKDRSMRSGDYQIRPVLTASGIGFLELVDMDHNKSTILASVGQSDYRWDEKSANKLTFVADNGNYTLASIDTATFRKTLPGVTASAQVITKNKAKAGDVTVALK